MSEEGDNEKLKDKILREVLGHCCLERAMAVLILAHHEIDSRMMEDECLRAAQGL